jgi:hypothetical protein
MRRLAGGVAVLAVLAAGCGETGLEFSEPPSNGPTALAAPTAVTGPTGPTPPTGPAGATAPDPCAEPGTLEVPSKANLFAAGIDRLPHPAGGGGGVYPVCVILPAGATTMQVTQAHGEASYNPSGTPTNGPDGDTSGAYAGGSLGPAGIVSGIESTARVGFVAGVFLGDGPPPGPPASVTVDDAYDVPEMAPELGQLFFVGDGAAGGAVQVFIVPPGATRLFLGIADGFNFAGPPGYYDDNSGSFTVTVSFGSGVD